MSTLAQRYIYEVTKRIPESQRKDVTMELETMIEDLVLSRAEEDKEVATKLVLKELGNPVLLASKYTNSKQYLIGPKWFEIYKIVLFSILKYALPIILIVLFIAGLVETDKNIIANAFGIIGDTIGIGIGITFWVTVVFAALERSNVEFKEFDTEWNPESLPEIPDTRQVSLVDSYLEIGTSLFSIAFLVYFSTLSIFNHEEWRPIGTAIALIFGATLVHNLFMLKAGRWTTGLVVAQVVMSIALIITAVVFVSTKDLVDSELIKTLTDNGIEDAKKAVSFVIYAIGLSVVLVSMWEIFDAVRKNLELRK